MQRYFATTRNEDIFTFDQVDSNHFTKVMRGSIDEKIEVVYERKVYICKIIKLFPLEAKICEEVNDKQNELYVDIAQALVKEQKMDYILQKSTELGVNNIIPLETTRSVVKINDKKDKKVDRWNKIVAEASKQSKRLEIPRVLDIISINNLSQLDYDYKVLCSVNEMSTNIKKVLEKIDIGARILFVVGPEGGFTKEEEQTLISNGFISVSLGNNVLRTETVSLFLLSIVNYHFMR